MAMQIRLERVAGLFSEGIEDAPRDHGTQLQAQKTARREALLKESLPGRMARLAQVVWRSLQPACLMTLAPTFDLIWREKTIGAIGLPDPETALANPDGLVGLVQDLSAPAMLAAFARGLHPRCLMGPATYWAPAQRLVAHPGHLALDNATGNMLRKGEFDVTFDRDFDALIEFCSVASPGKSRLNPKLLKAHVNLFDAGAAHGFEVRDRKGELVGGGYGIAFGRSFVMERWFGDGQQCARLGLAVLARHLASWGFRTLDATFVPDLAEGMGFRPVARPSYNATLEANASGGRPGSWRVDSALYTPHTSPAAVRHLFDAPAEVAATDAAELAETGRLLMASLGLPPAPQQHGSLPGVMNRAASTGARF